MLLLAEQEIAYLWKSARLGSNKHPLVWFETLVAVHFYQTKIERPDCAHV